MVLGVPMQEAPLKGRPVLDGPGREPEPARGVPLDQLQQRLNGAIVEAQTISLPVDFRRPYGGDGPR